MQIRTVAIPVPVTLIFAIKEYLKTHNLGKRGMFDGNKEKQRIGLIGECVVHHFLLGDLPDFSTRPDGFDGGFDLVYNGQKIDVKTMERKCYVRRGFVNNFLACQRDYDAEIIIFCSYNAIDNVLEVCGWLPKSELHTRGKYYAAGTMRRRNDGTLFELKADIYEVPVDDLDDIFELKNAVNS